MSLSLGLAWQGMSTVESALCVKWLLFYVYYYFWKLLL